MTGHVFALAKVFGIFIRRTEHIRLNFRPEASRPYRFQCAVRSCRFRVPSTEVAVRSPEQRAPPKDPHILSKLCDKRGPLAIRREEWNRVLQVTPGSSRSNRGRNC